MSTVEDKVERVTGVALKRGLFWPSFEIYGGVAGLYDIGPVGVRIKNRIVKLWRDIVIRENDDLVMEVETPIITPEAVLKASGHVDHFTDPVVECMQCHRVFRADHLVEEKLKINAEGLAVNELTQIISTNKIKCPYCDGELGPVTTFNLLFKTIIGPYSGSTGYMRPETAQGIFTSFKRVFESSRESLPLGIAQIGRVGRNEISPRQNLIRMRDFTIMELEFFFDTSQKRNIPWERVEKVKIKVLDLDMKRQGEKPNEYKPHELATSGKVLDEWMAYWMGVSQKFVEKLGIKNSYFEEKSPEERAHYSKQTFDLMVDINGTSVEISGIAYRGDYDLSAHMNATGKDLTVFKRYDTPKTIKKDIILIDKSKLIKAFGERGKSIIEKLSRMTKDELEGIVLSRKAVDDVIIAEYAIINQTEEKVSGERIVPHVIEPSFGVERCFYLSLINSFRIKENRNILSLPPEIAPFDLAVFPLLERQPLIDKSKELVRLVKDSGYEVFYDESGSIGKRYARADEIGIPLAITVDPQTLDDNTVTIRNRDTWEQVRVHVNNILMTLGELLHG
ncbi:glycine--tRNA ligase [Sulfolobales archaeon HS-7]|nr:glycine--tRNA ligase [Sulfolobales archaeon HS-7]